MAKSYPDQLAEWVKRRESTKRDKNLVAFLAVRGDIQLAIEAGYAVKTIWSNMHEAKRVSFGYDTFLNYVNRHIRAKMLKPIHASPVDTVPTEHKAPKKAVVATTVAEKPEPRVKAPEATPGFTFNSQPDAKDLI
jgi:hypothetical protein